ncbi:Card1-like endonuclease domain-containing protein [Methanobrevibacter arboriphilus]|nr:DUF1887 family CARF protein [Methanobrevibacter arboriphilus]
MEKLKERGCIEITQTENGKLIDDFIIEEEVSKKFFTFLVENNLNRYLFGLILRTKSMNIDNIPFFYKYLNKDTLKNKIKESCIKKIECFNCNHLLFREHIDDIGFDEEDITCPKCGAIIEFNFDTLKDDFDINRNDLIKFLEKLENIGVFKKDLKFYCNKCKNTQEYSENKDLICKCGHQREIKYYYSSNYEFLNNEGHWFEWYVYTICEDIYESVEHNIHIRHEKDGKKVENELDVVCFENETLIAFECKDYLSKIKTDDLSSIPQFSHLIDDIYVVSSTTKIKNNERDIINELSNKEIKYIEGTILEQKFFSPKNVISLINEKEYIKATNIYTKLSKENKKSLVDTIFSEIKNNENIDFFNSLILIIEREKHINSIFKNTRPKLDSVIQFAIDNLKNNKNVGVSYIFFGNLFRYYSKECIIKEERLNILINCGTNHLNPRSFSNYNNRRPFFRLITNLFKEEFNTDLLTYETSKKFLLKLIPMLDVYYSTNSRADVLNIFKKLWNCVDENIENNLISKTFSVYNKSNLGTKNVINNFLTDSEISFSEENKEKIEDFFN